MIAAAGGCDAHCRWLARPREQCLAGGQIIRRKPNEAVTPPIWWHRGRHGTGPAGHPYTRGRCHPTEVRHCRYDAGHVLQRGAALRRRSCASHQWQVRDAAFRQRRAGHGAEPREQPANRHSGLCHPDVGMDAVVRAIGAGGRSAVPVEIAGGGDPGWVGGTADLRGGIDAKGIVGLEWGWYGWRQWNARQGRAHAGRFAVN